MTFVHVTTNLNIVLYKKTLSYRTKVLKNLLLDDISVRLISLYLKLFLLDINNYIKKFAVNCEHGPIPEEWRVVTASWKRLGVVSGLRRTSTPYR